MQEIAKESQGEDKHSDDHDNGDAWKDSNILSCSACADHVIPCNRRDYARYHARSGIVDVSGSGRWCSHRAVPRNHECCHWSPLHALSPSHRQFWIFPPFLNFSLRVQFLILLTSCINSSSRFPVAMLGTLLHRENVIWRVVFARFNTANQESPMSSAWNCAIWNFQNILSKKMWRSWSYSKWAGRRVRFHSTSKFTSCMVRSQFFEKCWAWVEETRAAIMKSGCIWTLLVTCTLTDHEGSVIIAHCSKENPAPVHLKEKRASMATPCIHRMQITRFYAFWLCLRVFHGHGATGPVERPFNHSPAWFHFLIDSSMSHP